MRNRDIIEVEAGPQSELDALIAEQASDQADWDSTRYAGGDDFEPGDETRLLDPLAAYAKEAQRMHLVGARRGSYLNPNWEPVNRPYVKPEPQPSAAERHQAVLAALHGTVRVTGPWRDGLQDGGSPLAVHVPYPERTNSTVKRGVRVKPVRKDEFVPAWTPRRAHGLRFAPGGIPAGVNMDITVPHDCENHLD